MRAAEQNEQVHAAHLIATTQHPHGLRGCMKTTAPYMDVRIARGAKAPGAVKAPKAAVRDKSCSMVAPRSHLELNRRDAVSRFLHRIEASAANGW